MDIPLAIFDIGGQELLVIFLAVLLFMGPKKLPELARALAKMKAEFNRASRDFNQEIERVAEMPDSTPATAALTLAEQNEEPSTVNQPRRQESPSFAEITDVAGLPRILLIGDSISMGYTLAVREKLKGEANVHRPPENCGSTDLGLHRMDCWLGEKKWDLIHFNFGLHDLKYVDDKGNYVQPEKGKQVAVLAVYEKNLREIVKRLKQTGARLVFATTTPIPTGSLGRLENEELEYNQVAMKIMSDENISINDLYGFIKPNQQKFQKTKNVHFTETGYQELAERVAQNIRHELPIRKTNS